VWKEITGGLVCGSRTETMQKNSLSWTHWRPYFIQIQ